MKFILGTKQNMTQVFDENGTVHPVTLVSAGPVTVVALKTKERDGYKAAQLGYAKQALNRSSKPERGHLAKNLKDKAAGFKYLREWRDGTESSVGDMIDLGSFAEGELVTVSAISKGKGFQSVIKRHDFKGQPRSHGQKHCERAPGSIGGGLRNRVPKGMRMAGRMGCDRVTVKNLKIVQIDKDNHMVAIRGAIPGRRGTLVEIYNSRP